MKVQAILFATLLRARPALPSGLGAVASDVDDVDAALLDCALPCEKANLRASESKWRACLEANCGERRGPMKGEMWFDAVEEEEEDRKAENVSGNGVIERQKSKPKQSRGKKKDAEDITGNGVVDEEKKKKKKQSRGKKKDAEDVSGNPVIEGDKKKKKKKGKKSDVKDLTCPDCDGRNQNKGKDAFDEDPEELSGNKVIDRAPSKGGDKKKKKKKGEDISGNGVVDRVGKDKKKKKKVPKDQTTDDKKKKKSDGGSSKCNQCKMVRVARNHCARENCPHLLDRHGRLPERYWREFGLVSDEVEGAAGGGVEGAEGLHASG